MSCEENPEESKVKIFCHSCRQKLDVTTFEPYSRFACPICRCELSVPEKFGKYLLAEKLGGNGIFSAYRAYDTEEAKTVGLTIFSEAITSGTDAAKHLESAINGISAVSCQSIVPVYETGIEKGRFFFASKYMAFGNLEKRLEEAHGSMIPPKRAARWMLEAAKALAKAEKHGITHGDVKPENIFFDEDGRACVGNFGITDAVFSALADADKAQDFTPETTPCYVSPEKLMRSGDDCGKDVFSLGAVFYRLVTGKQAFSGSSTEALIHARLDEAVSSPSSVRPEIPENVSSLIMAMMSFDKDGRPSYAAIINALENFLSDGNAVSTGKKLKNDVSSSKQNDDYCVVRQKSSSLTGCFLTFVIILLAAGLFLLWRGQFQQSDASSEKQDKSKTEEPAKQKTSDENAASAVTVQKPEVKVEAKKEAAPREVQSEAKNEAAKSETEQTKNPVLTVSEGNQIEVEKAKAEPEKEEASNNGIRTYAEDEEDQETAFGKNPAEERAEAKADEPPAKKDVVKSEAPDWKKEIMAAREEQTDGNLKLSAAAIDKNEKKYGVKRRPLPDAPSRITPEKMKNYVLSLPEEMRKPELRRVIALGEMPDYVTKISKFGAYPVKGFKDTNGKKIEKGSGLFSPDHILVRHGSSGKYTKISWDELPYSEFVNVMKYYVEMREKITEEEDDTPNPIDTPEDRQRREDELGRAFMRLSLIYDWYGRSGEACEAAEKAVKHAPVLKKEIEDFLLK